MKPAGQQSDFRAIAAMVALRVYSKRNWVGLAGAWVGSLLQEGQVFLQKATEKVFLSLGFLSQAACLWQLEPLGDSLVKIQSKQSFKL